MAATLNQNRDAVCRRAMRLCGLYAGSESPEVDDMVNVVEALNAMTKEWQADGLHVWTEVEGFIAPVAGQTQYMLGAGSSDRFGTGLVKTVLAQDALPNAGTISLASVASVQVGDAIGVGTASGVVWMSVSAVSSLAGTVSLSAPGFTAGAVAGSPVVAYHPASSGFRPLRILGMRRSNMLSGIDIPITQYARLDYQALPNKMQPGTINTWFYDAQLNSGLLQIWQAPAPPVTDILTFTFMRELTAWANPSDVGDFPGEWTSALAYNLAVEIAPEFDVPLARYQMLAAKAAEKKMVVQGFDREPESITFGVSLEPGYR